MTALPPANPDLVAEFERACAAMRDQHFARLNTLGVGREAYIIAKPLLLPAPIGMARVEIEGSAYQPAEQGGRGMFVQPVLDSLDELVDVVAWHPDAPGRWFMRHEAAPIMGADIVEEAAFFGDILVVHPTPLEWLKAGGGGACVLDWDRAWFWLGCVRDIAPLHTWTQRRLENALRSPRPTTRIRKAEADAEAA